MELPKQIRDAIVAHARFAHPDEACGLLAADKSGKLRMVYCLTNSDASPDRFTIDPAEHYGALCNAEANGWELAGAYHSHPATEASPSAADVALALEPNWVYLIAGLKDPDRPEVRGFWIRARSVVEEPLEVGGGSCDCF